MAHGSPTKPKDPLLTGIQMAPKLPTLNSESVNHVTRLAPLSTVATELGRLERYGTGLPNWPPWSKWSGTIRGKKIVTLQRASFAKENSCTRLCVQQLWSNDLPPANEHVRGVRKGTSQLIAKETAQHIQHLITLCFGRKNWSVLRTNLLLAALTCFA